MRVIKNVSVLVLLMLSIGQCVGQDLNVYGINLSVSKTRMVSLDIPEINENGVVKRVIEINRLVEYNDYTFRANKCKISLKKKSNKSRRSIKAGTYEIVVTYFINGVTSKKREVFEVI